MTPRQDIKKTHLEYCEIKVLLSCSSVTDLHNKKVLSFQNIARQLDTQPQEKRNDVVIGYVYYDYAENQKGKPLNRYRSQQPRKELYEPGISYQYYDSDMSITRTENLVDDTNKTHEDKKKQNGGKRKNPLFSPFGYGRIKN